MTAGRGGGDGGAGARSAGPPGPVAADPAALRAAARRELGEEAGVTGIALEPLGARWYADETLAEVAEVYLARSDGPFACPDGEVVELDWLEAGELDRWLVGREVCPDSVALVLPRLPGPGGAP